MAFKKNLPLHKNNAVNLDTNKRKMVQRLCGFLVVFLLMFSGKSFGQDNLIGFSDLKPSGSINYTRIKSLKPAPLIAATGISDSHAPTQNFISLKIISPSYNLSCLGFFCKKELQLDKVIAVPLRFRLGSLAYVNYLEQKPNALKPF